MKNEVKTQPWEKPDICFSNKRRSVDFDLFDQLIQNLSISGSVTEEAHKISCYGNSAWADPETKFINYDLT